MRTVSRALVALVSIGLTSPAYSQSSGFSVFSARVVQNQNQNMDEVTVELNAAGGVNLGSTGTPTLVLNVPSVAGVAASNVSCNADAMPLSLRVTTSSDAGGGLNTGGSTTTIANSCQVKLSRAANAAPLPQKLSFQTPGCGLGITNCPSIATPDDVTLRSYEFGGSVAPFPSTPSAPPAPLAALKQSEPLGSGTIYHVGLIATNVGSVGVKGPYALTFKRLSGATGDVQIGGNPCRADQTCICEVPATTDRCAITLPSTEGSYAFTVQSDFVRSESTSLTLTRSTTPTPTITISRSGEQVRTVPAPAPGASPGAANLVQLVANVANATAGSKLTLTSTVEARGELSCGHAPASAAYSREVQCDVVQGQVQFRARVKAAGEWAINASLGAVTSTDLYKITQESNPSIRLDGVALPTPAVLALDSSTPLRFKVDPPIDPIPNCNFTAAGDGSNPGAARWERPAGTPIVNPQPCNSDVVLKATSAGTIKVTVAVTAGTVNAFEEAITINPAPSLAVGVAGSLPAGSENVSGTVTATNLPANTPITLSVVPGNVSEGPTITANACAAPSCSFQLTPGNVVGTFSVRAVAGQVEGSASLRITRTTGGLSFIPEVVRLPVSIESTLSVELETALAADASPLTVTLARVPEDAPLSVGSCVVQRGQRRCEFKVTPSQLGAFRLRATAGSASALLALESVAANAAPQLTGFDPPSLRLAPEIPAATPNTTPPPSTVIVSFANLPATVPSVGFEIVGGSEPPKLSPTTCTPAQSNCTLRITPGKGLGSYTLRMVPNATVVAQQSLTLIVSNTESLGRTGASASIASDLERAAGNDPVAAAAAQPMADVCTSSSAGQNGSEPLRVTCRALIERAETAGTADTSAADVAAADVRTALRALNGEEVKGLSDASIAIQRQRQGLVTNRMQELRRGGGRGFSADALSIQQGAHSISVAQALALGKSLAGMNDTGSTSGVTVESLEGWGGFISGNWSREDRDDLGIDRGYEVDGYNLLAGLDREVVPGLVLGFAFGAARTDLEYGGAGGVVDTDSRSVTAYGAASFANGASLDAALTYGRFSHRFERVINLSGLRNASIDRSVVNRSDILADFRTRSDVDGSEWILSSNLGYPLELKEIAEWTRYITRTTVTPTIGVVYGRVSVDAFEEQDPSFVCPPTPSNCENPNVWRLAVPSHSYSQLQAVLSVDLHNSWELIYRDSLLTLDAALQGYVDVLGGSTTKVPTRLAAFNQPFTSFELDTRSQAYGTLELGLGWALPGSLNLRLSSGTYFGLDQSSRYYINLGGGYTF